MEIVFASWPLWVLGTVVLLGSGFAAAFVPRWRAAGTARRSGWLMAGAAIDSAAVSRDACGVRVPAAERLLAQAVSLAAGRGGRVAAGTATRYARRADELWRSAGAG